MIDLFAAAALGLAAPQAPPPLADLNEFSVSAEHEPARLDALVAAQDWMTLGRTIQGVRRQADLRSDLDWLRAKFVEGNSAFVAMLYSRLLWVAAEGLPAELQRPLRQTAVMASVYAFGAMHVDGARCGDPSAPLNRQQQLLTVWNSPLLEFAATLSEPERQQIVDIAAAIEARTADRRAAIGDVQFLCRAGMEETSYNLRTGTSREVPSAPGQFGRTIELSGDGNYRPSERPEAEWRAEAQRRRAGLRAELTQFLSSIAGARGQPPD